jgi:putative hydrolase of the HAD superfamily
VDEVKVVSFDLDNTLWDNDVVIARAEREHYRWLQDNVPAFGEVFSADELIRLRVELVSERPELEARISELRKTALERALRQVVHRESEVETLKEEAFSHFLSLRNQVSLFPGALPLLSTLQQDYQLAALTNGNSDIQVIGIDRFFDFSTSAEVIGTKKPGREMFDEMMNHFGVAPESIVHIGDHPIDDIAGAAAVGLKTVWFNPAGAPWSEARGEAVESAPHIIPDAEVACLTEIPALIKAMEQKSQPGKSLAGSRKCES